MLRRIIGLVLVAVAVSVTASSARAALVVWSTTGLEIFDEPNTTGDINNFDNAQITFDGFLASALDEIEGDGLYHSHGTETFTLQLRLDGVFTIVFTIENLFENETDTPIATFAPTQPQSSAAPILFPTATVTGIRLSADPPSGFAWHQLEDDIFKFNTITPLAAIPVPEPSTLALFVVGLAGLGFMMQRRRKLAWHASSQQRRPVYVRL